MNKKNIVGNYHIGHVVATLRTGGAERLVQMLACRQKELGQKVTVIKVLNADNTPTEIERILLNENIDFVHILDQKSLDCISMKDMFKLIVIMKKLIYERRIDILHCHVPIAIPGCLVGSKFAKTGFVITEHNDTKPSKVGVLRGGVSALLGLRYAAVSHSVYSRLKSSYHIPESHIKVIHNGITSKPFELAKKESVETLRVEYGLPLHKVLIGTTCNVRPAKDIETYIRSCELLEERYPQKYCFVHIGKNEDDQIIQLGAKLEEKGAYISLGPQSEVSRILRTLDIYAITSRWEGMPVSIAEAMLSNLPVISTDIASIAYSYGRENLAKIIPVGGYEELAEAVIEITDNPAKYIKIANKANETALSKFSIEECAKQYELLYDEILTKRKVE